MVSNLGSCDFLDENYSYCGSYRQAPRGARGNARDFGSDRAEQRAFATIVQGHSGVERFHVHQTRHTFATRWLENGGSLAALHQIRVNLQRLVFSAASALGSTSTPKSKDRVLMDAQSAESLLKFADSVDPALRGIEAKAVFEKLDQQYGDLLSGIQWFIAQGRTDESLRLASSLVPFWMATKRLDEGSAWLDRVLGLPGGDDAHRGRALFDAGYLAFWRGDDERSSAFQNRAIVIGRRTNNPTVTALALVGLARIALRTNVDEARRLCREALAVTEGTADQAGRSSAMHVLGVAAQMAGDLLEAREVMRQRIVLARETENFATVSIEANNLSMVERQLGNLDAAEALAREALDIGYRRRDDLAIPWNCNGLAAVARDRGEFDRAATLIGIADATMESTGGAWPPDELVHYEQTVATLAEAMGSAEFERTRAAGRSMSTARAVDFALGTRSAG